MIDYKEHKLYKIDDTEVEITKIEFDGDTKNNVIKLEIDYNYFVNDILIRKEDTDA